MKSYRPKRSLRRIVYMHERYCSNPKLSIDTFISEINSAYYRYAAAGYEQGEEKRLEKYYAEFFNSLPPGLEIIDIGAGTGFVHTMLEKIGYKYSCYYFVEPAKEMSDRFLQALSHPKNLTIISAPIQEAWQELRSRSHKRRVLVINGALHHMIYLDQFLSDIRDFMNGDDIFLIALEPNNAYFHSIPHFIWSSISFSPRDLFYRVARPLKKKIYDGWIKRKTIPPVPHSDPALNHALKWLQERRTVKADFTADMIYAITDYQVYDNWRSIHVPNRFNEGFMTLKGIARMLQMQPILIRTFHHFHHPGTRVTSRWKWLEIKIAQLFPKSGYQMFLALKKPG